MVSVAVEMLFFAERLGASGEHKNRQSALKQKVINHLTMINYVVGKH